jgi:hypothetical protein
MSYIVHQIPEGFEVRYGKRRVTYRPSREEAQFFADAYNNAGCKE